MEKMKDILNKSLNISLDNFFNVDIIEKESIHKPKIMNYLELGTFLISNSNNIRDIKIHMKD